MAALLLLGVQPCKYAVVVAPCHPGASASFVIKLSRTRDTSVDGHSQGGQRCSGIIGPKNIAERLADLGPANGPHLTKTDAMAVAATRNFKLIHSSIAEGGV
jgi:hypothetical protein